MGPVVLQTCVMSHEYIYYQNVQILHDAIIIKTKFLLPQSYMTLPNFCYPVLLLPKSFKLYLAFQSFDFEHNWWRLFQKRILSTKLEIVLSP